MSGRSERDGLAPLIVASLLSVVRTAFVDSSRSRSRAPKVAGPGVIRTLEGEVPSGAHSEKQTTLASHVMTTADAKAEAVQLSDHVNFVSAFRAWAAVRPPLALNGWQQRFATFGPLFKGRDPSLPERGPDYASLVSAMRDQLVFALHGPDWQARLAPKPKPSRGPSVAASWLGSIKAASCWTP